MAKKANKKFDEKYAQLEKDCCVKFGIVEGGVAEYIDRLKNLHYAPNRDELLPALEHMQALSQDSSAAKKNDLKWVEDFDKKVAKKKDSLSDYLKDAKKFARSRKSKKAWIAVLVILVIVLGAAAAALALSRLGMLPAAVNDIISKVLPQK